MKTNTVKALKRKAQSERRIVLTGFITGQPLKELFSHAGLFVLPSYYEGLPIALLESDELRPVVCGVRYPGQP